LDPGEFKLECISQTSVGQYICQAIIFPMVVLLLYLAFAISTLFPRRMNHHKILNTILTVNQGLLITFSNLSMAAYQCYVHPNKELTLYMFSSVLCYNEAYGKFVGVSIFMIMTVIVPFNAIFIHAVYTVYKYRHNDEVSMNLLVKYKSLFSKWRPQCWYFGVFMTLRQQMLTCTLLFFKDDVWGQTIWIVLVIVASSIVTAFVVPWRLFEVCVFETFVNFCVVTAIFCMAAFNEQTTRPQRFEVVSFISCCFFFCASCIYFFRIGVTFRGRDDVYVSYPTNLTDSQIDECFLSVAKIGQLCQADRKKLWSFFLTESDRHGFKTFIGSLWAVLPENVESHRAFIPHSSFLDHDGINHSKFQSAIQSQLETKSHESYI